MQAEPTLGPIQALEVYDPLVAKIEAVLEYRKALVAARTLLLHLVGDQLTKLPTEIRDQLNMTGKIESRLRQLETIDPSVVSTPAGDNRLSWLTAFIDQDRTAQREVRRLERLIDELLDDHGTTLREGTGIGPTAAATLVCQVGDPTRFSSESKFARWCGTGAVALSSAEGAGAPTRHRFDLGGNRTVNSVLYIASITQGRDDPIAQTYLARKTAEGKTRREPGAPTSDTSPTGSSDACGETNAYDKPLRPTPLDQGSVRQSLRLSARLRPQRAGPELPRHRRARTDRRQHRGCAATT